ncbi:MAG: thioredoxin-dependent thiol peroxidase [bacterium]|nr:thioredoxin-dependent thiol peroxidase [bacterium]
MLKLNTKAPNLSLPDQAGKMHSLADYKGKWVLIYFYPKDDTPGCTKEACIIRDNLPDFKKLNCVVLGISVDSVKSHSKFAEKYKLPFTLLADEKKEVVKKYGAWQKKSFLDKSYMDTKRISYLINPDGKIAKIYSEVKPTEHAEEVLKDINLQTK